MGADMVHLVDHHRAMLVAGLCDAPEGRDDRIVLGAEIAAGQDAGLMHRRGLDDDHGRPTARPLAVIAEMALRGQALDAHIRRMGAEDEAMLQGLVAQLQGLEEMGEGLLGHRGVILLEMTPRS